MKYHEIKAQEPEPVDKKTKFADNVFNELQDFNIEYQVEILKDLYYKLKEKYLFEISVTEKGLMEMKAVLEILETIDPDRKTTDYENKTR